MAEVWKDIKGYESLYQVSNFGRVKSLLSDKERILKSSKNTQGYLKVNLCIDGLSITKKVHRLVCEAFLPNLENKRTVNHKNGIRSDNRLENLEWATDSENNKHAYNELGKTGPMTGKLGINNPNSIPVCRYSQEGDFIDEFEGAMDAERKTGINHRCISYCCKGKYKSSGSYIWRYK